MKLKLSVMSTVIERLNSFIKEKGETKNSFSTKVGINPSNFNRKMKGELPFTNKDFVKIYTSTGLGLKWLEFGEGDMIAEQPAIQEEDKPQSSQSDAKPFYDVDFALGFGSMYNDTPNVPSKYIAIPGYEKADFWCRTSGDSMKPLINSGDIIALKEVVDWNVFLPLNEVYAIVTTNDMRTVKMVRRGSDDLHFLLHAINEEFGDQEIPKAAIMKVFKVIGALKTM